MGCGSSTPMNYTVIFCSLDPMIGKENEFKIKSIAEEEYEKREGMTLLNQIGKSENSEITQFLNRPNIEANTLFYFYFNDELLIKNYNQVLKFIPSNSPLLKKIFVLSIDSATDIPSQAVENETRHIDQSDFIGTKINFEEIKNKLKYANNPNITKDSLTLNETLAYDSESVVEKPEEILICGEEVTAATYEHVVAKFKAADTKNNANLETSADNKDVNKGNSNIKAVKIYTSKFNNLNIFYNIMHLIWGKNIRKFSFYENNTNSDFEGWEAISEFFEKNYFLRYIDLHSSNLYDQHLKDLMNALIDKRIRYLDLSENFITLDGLEIIANFLKNNKTLQKLNLCRNAQCQFKPDGVKLITEALIQNPNIEFIDFSYMNLTGCGVYIGNFISENKNIKSIILRNVMLNAVDFKNIFVPLKNNDVLQEIDISLNDMGGDKSLQYIADAIIENKTLHTVKMDQININNDNYEIIFKAIEQNKTITSYSVNFNSKIKPMIMLNFFIKQKHVKHLEYDPFDKENPNDKKKELTLEEKKMFSKFKTERPDMKLIYK
jgi:hypothetical protein